MEPIVQEIKFFLTVEQLLRVLLESNLKVGGLSLNLAIDKTGKVWITAKAVERKDDIVILSDVIEPAVPTPPGAHGSSTIDLTRSENSELKAFFNAVLPDNSKPFSESLNSFQ